MPFVLLPVLTIAACSDKPAAAPAPGSSASAAAPAAGASGVASPGASAEPGSYAEVVQARLPEVAVDRRNDEIEAIAQKSCASLAAGKNKDAVVAETQGLATTDPAATDPDIAKELIRLAIERVCPAQTKRFAEF